MRYIAFMFEKIMVKKTFNTNLIELSSDELLFSAKKQI